MRFLIYVPLVAAVAAVVFMLAPLWAATEEEVEGYVSRHAL